MAYDFILYIIAGMVIWDFTLHIDDILLAYKKISKPLHPFGAGKLFRYLSKGDKEKFNRIYQVFWASYYGIASFLMVFYILTM